MRLSDDLDANYYAYPLDLCVEMTSDLTVTNIFNLPSGEHDRATTGSKPTEFDRRKIHEGSEYYPTLNTEQRTTTKPYHVSQPEGPSFSIEGNKISWEKWTMRVGFNYREGMTLHDIRFDGRSLFYRLSLAEMFVPYGDPRTPYPRKAAFDLGNDGAGLCANNLQLGCDCLGHIKYFDGWVSSQSGTPLKLPNVICCHEIDDGILWKHTNFRTGNAAVTRSRVLALQTIITASNYEYIFLFHFSQDASIHYEVRATGILSTAPIALGTTVPYGTVVAPGVMAPYHQHLFCLRIDPALDGHANSLVVEQSLPLPFPSNNNNSNNPHAVGYTTTQHYVPHETGLDLDHAHNRVFKIVNERVLHPHTRTPVGFRLQPCYSAPILAHPSSFHARRSEFGRHAVWVTRYQDDEAFPAGRFTMQSGGGEGIASWIDDRRVAEAARVEELVAKGVAAGMWGEEPDRRDGDAVNGVRDADIVVWHTFGSTHNPRAEDWPVMPVEKMVVGLKPVNFFERNPALDVAMSTQARNKSVLVGEGKGGGVGGCCDL
jgi:primary-amine oxidase